MPKKCNISKMFCQQCKCIVAEKNTVCLKGFLENNCSQEYVKTNCSEKAEVSS